MSRTIWPAALVASLAFGVIPSAAPRDLSQTSQPLTLAQIVARYDEAHGHPGKWDTIQTIKRTCRATAQGFEVPMVLYLKRPNMSRQEITAGDRTMVSGFDGTTAWTTANDPGAAPVVLSGPQLEATKAQSKFDPPLMGYEARGDTLSLVGLEPVNGVRVYHLELRMKGGPTLQIYLDASTFLETAVISEVQMGGSGVTLETDFSDYKDVDGLMEPHRLRTLTNNVLGADVIVDKTEFNVPLDDALFKIPAK